MRHYSPPTMICACLQVAVMFAVMNGFIIALILSSSSSRHQYKLKMDVIMVSSLQHSVPAECTAAAGGAFNRWMLCRQLLLIKPPSRLCESRQLKQEFICKVHVTESNHALCIIFIIPCRRPQMTRTCLKICATRSSRQASACWGRGICFPEMH